MHLHYFVAFWTIDFQKGSEFSFFIYQVGCQAPLWHGTVQVTVHVQHTLNECLNTPSMTEWIATDCPPPKKKKNTIRLLAQ